jgi:ABC-2 type transport system ATP-binding protein
MTIIQAYQITKEKTLNAVETHNLTKTYGKQRALNDVSITVPKGGVYALVGQNGAGKTTLLKILAGLATRTSGDYKLLDADGNDEHALQSSRRRTGTIIESPAMFNITAQKNLEYYLLQKGIKDKGKIDNALQRVNLTDTGKKRFRNFSLGMKQRLGLAFCLLSDPEILILDEPINGLDPTGIVEIREALISLSKEGVTILISSHILSELELIATNYGFIHKGRLAIELTAEELRDKCATSFKIKTPDFDNATAIVKQYSNNFKTEGDALVLYDFETSTDVIIAALVNGGVRVFEAIKHGETLEDYYIGLVSSLDLRKDLIS